MNLSVHFNVIFDGVVTGQLGYTNIIPETAETFLPQYEQTFNPLGNSQN